MHCNYIIILQKFVLKELLYLCYSLETLFLLLCSSFKYKKQIGIALKVYFASAINAFAHNYTSLRKLNGKTVLYSFHRTVLFHKKKQQTTF